MDFLRSRGRRHFSLPPRFGGPANPLSRSRLSMDAHALRSGRRGHCWQRRLSRLSRPFSVQESRRRHPAVSNRSPSLFLLAQTRRLLNHFLFFVVAPAAAGCALCREEDTSLEV